MGMFDRIQIQLDQLPLNEEEKKELEFEDYLDWQTKAFDCNLDAFFINNKGELIKLPFESDEFIYMNYHGVFNFYTLTNKGNWYEFTAKFTDGKLIEIKRIITDAEST